MPGGGRGPAREAGQGAKAGAKKGSRAAKGTPFAVLLTDQAVRDLNDIGDFIAAREGEELADAMLDRLEGAILSLAALPDRGDIPPELERIGVLTYRELHEKPYRILYRREANTVFIHAILDARRDVQSLLGERVLR